MAEATISEKTRPLTSSPMAVAFETSFASAPPSYEEATSGEGLKAGAFPPAPSAVPLHPKRRIPLAVVLPPPARGAGTLIPSAQRLVWASGILQARTLEWVDISSSRGPFCAESSWLCHAVYSLLAQRYKEVWLVLATPRACVSAQLLQLCLALCDPMDCSLLGCSVYGILH